MGWSERLVTWFTVCTIIMLVYAVTTHSWILVESNSQIYYSGMWKVCLKLVCTGLIDIAPNVEGARTLLVLALFSSILGASFMTFTYRYSPDAMINRYLVAAMGSLIAAALVFLALSIYTIRISTHGISRTGQITYLPPFYVAWASCPSFILSGLFALMAHQRLLMQGPTLPDGESTMSSSSSDWLTSSSSFLDTESESAMSQRQDKQSVGTKRTVRSSLTSAGYYNYYA